MSGETMEAEERDLVAEDGYVAAMAALEGEGEVIYERDGPPAYTGKYKFRRMVRAFRVAYYVYEGGFIERILRAWIAVSEIEVFNRRPYPADPRRGLAGSLRKVADIVDPDEDAGWTDFS